MTDSQVALAIKWYETKEAVWRAKRKGSDAIAIFNTHLEARVVVNRQVTNAYISHRLNAMDDFNWSANVLFATESWQKVPFTRDEIDTYLDHIVNPRGGYAPANYEAELKRRHGTLRPSPVDDAVILDYDENDRPQLAGLCKTSLGNTIFQDIDEAIAVFGSDVVSDVLEGGYKRVSYLTFD